MARPTRAEVKKSTRRAAPKRTQHWAIMQISFLGQPKLAVSQPGRRTGAGYMLVPTDWRLACTCLWDWQRWGNKHARGKARRTVASSPKFARVCARLPKFAQVRPKFAQIRRRTRMPAAPTAPQLLHQLVSVGPSESLGQLVLCLGVFAGLRSRACLAFARPGDKWAACECQSDTLNAGA